LRSAIAIALFACALAGASCAAVIGLEDHELAPDAGVLGEAGGDSGTDAAPPGCTNASTCATGYACVDGHCTNEVSEVAASETHACAVLRGGELWCWGKNQFGSLGVDPNATPKTCGSYACSPSPVKAGIASNVAHVAVGQDFTCALSKSGELSCFGVDSQSQLARNAPDSCVGSRAPVEGGVGAALCDAVPGRVAIGGDGGVVQIVASSSHACARTADGTVLCWGDDYLGESGIYPIPDGGGVASPTIIGGLASSVAIATSGSLAHACAANGAFAGLACWGSNVSGELGHMPGANGDKACVFGVACAPQGVGAGLLGANAMALGEKVTCVRKGDGTVVCFGGNDSGQLGNGSSVDT
jgi:alpha-tubulin suppressor-like RCC1 family protein